MEINLNRTKSECFQKKHVATQRLASCKRPPKPKGGKKRKVLELQFVVRLPGASVECLVKVHECSVASAAHYVTCSCLIFGGKKKKAPSVWFVNPAFRLSESDCCCFFV